MQDDLARQLRRPQVQIAVLAGTLALALITNSLFGDPRSGLSFLPVLFGVMVAAEIALFVGMEMKEGAEKHGWKHEVVDTIIALAIAVGIWFGASLVLNTSSPVSAVVSCSMLPNLQRGDFVIVQGAPLDAYELGMTQGELDSLSSPAVISYSNSTISINGSLFSYCVADSRSQMCRAFISSPGSFTEKKGAFTYRYERCGIQFTNGSSGYMPCLKSVEFHGKEYLTNLSNDVVVYQPGPGDVYARVGDIVHRAMFKIDVDGKEYYLTRGDNNPLLDIQVYDYVNSMGNAPVPQERLRGKVIGRIPLLGYFKLFISGYFQEDPQCRTQISFDTVE